MTKINDATVDLVKLFEGLRLKAYKDAVGVLTIGYGTTAAAGVGIVPHLGMTITEAEAETYLTRALEKFAAKISPKITAPINENEFGAFLSLAYNIGPGAFAKSSALRKFNAGDKAGAANAILLWNKAGGKVLSGLVRRREAERDLFLSPIGKTMPAAKPATPSKRPAQSAKPSAPPSPAKSGGGAVAALLGGALVLIGAKIDAITAWVGSWWPF
jgi:lysozyme